MSVKRVVLCVCVLGAFSGPAMVGQTSGVDSTLFNELTWRNIGPLRAGRTRAAVGDPERPNVLYIGVTNGGVWKTTDYGRTWEPIFDEQPTGSIGDIAVSESSPNILYVASGEGLQRPDLSVGNGVYKSTDGGTTWAHLGLLEGQQLARIIVDPKNPDRVFVAVLGHPYGPNKERGIYRSLDGGKSFQPVLQKDEDTGGNDVEFDPVNADVVYATLWEARQGPWENAAWPGTGGGIFKSVDGGTTWTKLTKGLPEEGIIQADIAVAPSNNRRVFATVATPRGVFVYRSDDAGETWRRIGNDPRVSARIGGGDLPPIVVHPKNADVVFTTAVVSWKSEDGGETWSALWGAPGGNDPQRLWIHPTSPDVMLLATDQGAVVSVNAGQSWSSWFNQSTAQLYHVSADNAFPYRLCSGQQENGSACVSSRGDDGQITMREWHPVGVEEYGFVAPDPLNPDIVYGGKVTKYDRRTGIVQNVGPRPLRGPDYRAVRTMPVVFSPADAKALYVTSNHVWKTITGGQSWDRISPDLTRATWDVPATVGKYRSQDSATPTQRGVIYALGPSYQDANTLWAGTDDGLIHVTRDGGKTWQNVTPSALTPWMKVAIIDPSHFDENTAYAAVNTIRLDDMRPHIYRTHDGGKTWTLITNGISDGWPVNVVREDPQRKGLLFAGTEQTVWVSFDDGDHWQSLRRNLPATSIRDLIIKDDDLAIATHGRGFYILDDITPLRQLTAEATAADAHLFRPQSALRWRFNKNTDTPFMPDEPRLPNPPDGALIHYVLKTDARGPVTLEILDATGGVVRTFSSADQADPPLPNPNIPDYWIRPWQPLSAKAGLHRFVWDVHYPPPAVLNFSYPIAAVPFNTPKLPVGVWALPGAYSVRLTVDGRTQVQPLVLKMDPRVKTPALGLKAQFDAARQIDAALTKSYGALMQARAATGEAAQKAAQELQRLNGRLTQLLDIVEDADAPPTTQALAAIKETQAALATALADWTKPRP